MRKKTHEEYINEVKKINPNIEVLEQYKNSDSKILHKCKIDNYEWEAAPHNILRGTGCPKCGIKTASKKMSKTHEQYVKEVVNINKNIEVVGRYINSKTKILHRCKIDSYEWYTSPNCIIKGGGCPICGRIKTHESITKTHEQYVEEVTEINEDIEVVGKYINTNTPILHRCKINDCQHEWLTKPSHILDGHGCPKCGNCANKTHEEYVAEVENVNPNIKVLGTYINSKLKIRHKCLVCNYEWDVVSSSILHGIGCPKCSMSHGERKIEDYLIKHNINYISQYKFEDCKNIRQLPFDFYLPKYNACIEYNGIQHYESIDWFGGEEGFIYRKQNDAIKTQYCENNNIKLIIIKYNQNVDKVLDKLLI